MQFVYYIPATVSTATFFDARRDIFEGAKRATGAIDNGPDQGGGGLLTIDDGDAAARLQKADALEWERVQAEGFDYYIGYDADNLPGPEELQREGAVFFFDPIPLGDGRFWRLPTGRLYPEGSPLPKVRKVWPDGTVQRKVKRKWHSLLKITDEVWEAFELVQDLTPDREAEVCRVALSTNYRIGLPEISILELLDDQGVYLILAALVDRYNWPKIEGDD